MKKFVNFSMLLSLLVGFASMAAPTAALARSTQAAGPQTYTVMVGAEKVSRGIDIMAFFPATLRIHVGDTVVWKQNSFEIHTVTFLAGAPMPALVVPAPAGQPSPLMLNPQVAFPAAPADGMYDGSTFANSGVMSLEAGQPQQFSLTFTQAGTYAYICVIHGEMMSGNIEVVDPSVAVASPGAVAKLAHKVMRNQLARANKLLGIARSQVPHSEQNADGTTTHFVEIGYSKGQVDLMSFFPGKLVVHPGDTVKFELSETNMAPHTVTFLNGGEDIEFVTPVPNPADPSGPPLLLANPQVLMPINAGQPLTRDGVFSSGLLDPSIPGAPTSFELKIGDISGEISYECLLHDLSGMTGVLEVVP
jgi:plastocyanin